MENINPLSFSISIAMPCMERKLWVLVYAFIKKFKDHKHL